MDAGSAAVPSSRPPGQLALQEGRILWGLCHPLPEAVQEPHGGESQAEGRGLSKSGGQTEVESGHPPRAGVFPVLLRATWRLSTLGGTGVPKSHMRDRGCGGLVTSPRRASSGGEQPAVMGSTQCSGGEHQR